MVLQRWVHEFAPRLFSFAYPMQGRGVRPLRRAALRLWVFLMTNEAGVRGRP